MPDPRHTFFLVTHPIQYLSPLFQRISDDPDFDLTVLFCSKHSVDKTFDAEFGVKVAWDIPLLEGYQSRFLKNHSWKPSHYNGFLGLINLGIIPLIFKAPKKSIIIIHGWAYLTHILAFLIGKILGHTVCLRAESPLCHELIKPKRMLRRRHIFFKYLLFPLVSKFLYIGQQNKGFYKYYKVNEADLVFAPYSVDNKRFFSAGKKLIPERNLLKEKAGIPPGHRVILFSGKFIPKKRPMDLLKAFYQQNPENCSLVFMGEGSLREEMESFICQNKIRNVLLTGFINQTKVPEFYAMADIFVMCSQQNETWGLSTNEAMNFSVALAISDLTGCHSDLVEEGKNGIVFSTGNISQLSDGLGNLLAKSDDELAEMGRISNQIIEKYSYQEIIKNLNTI